MVWIKKNVFLNRIVLVKRKDKDGLSDPNFFAEGDGIGSHT